jgi:hypothetical protein
MSTCDDLFAEAFKWSKGQNPVRWFPSCHPKSGCNVFIDGKKRAVTISCAKCDRTMGVFTLKSGKVSNGKPI